jgi:hypothetical protein
MKKVIFCAIALMLGGMTYAQYGPQYAGPTETSKLQPALPGAAVDANTGLSIQKGMDQKVRVEQAGTQQSAFTYQENGSGAGGNLAWICQTGVNMPTSGVQNAADIIQSGDVNQSFVRQEGDFNSAITKQGLNYASTNNKAHIHQGEADQAEYNIAKLEQDGADNQGHIFQTYDRSDAWTIQDGERNNSYVRQIAPPDKTGGHYAYTKQIGNDNKNTIWQVGMFGEGDWAWAYQTGDANGSYQSQMDTGTLINYALVDQGAGQSGIFTSDNLTALTTLDSKVSEKLAGLSDFTSGSLAFQNQDGEDLDAETHQYGTDSYSEQNQTGSGNDAFVVQDSHGETGHYARQDQDGTDSYATLSQFGNGNKAWQRQLDDDNIIVSSQIGHDNKLNTYQDGNGNRGNTIQHGHDNIALLTQRGGHSYSLEQYGKGNQTDILQLGPDGDFTADYIAFSFEIPLTAPPMNDIPDLVIPDL